MDTIYIISDKIRKFPDLAKSLSACTGKAVEAIDFASFSIIPHNKVYFIVIDLDNCNKWISTNDIYRFLIFGYSKNPNTDIIQRSYIFSCRAIVNDKDIAAVILPAVHLYYRKIDFFPENLQQSYGPGLLKYFTQTVIENELVWISLNSRGSGFLLWNRAAELITGYSSGEVVGNPKILFDLYGDTDYMLEVQRLIKDHIINNDPEPVSIKMKSKSGHNIFILLWVHSIGTDEAPLFLSVGHNITKLVAQENELNLRLAEKELLLKEIHHRVKNNLQIISSLINLQMDQYDDDRITRGWIDTQNRVKSMALIHEKLYQTSLLTGINFADYIGKLSNELIDAFNVTDKIGLKLKLEPVELNLNTSIPLGLICNEILTNAIKYGFPNKEKGVVSIALQRKNNEVLLVIGDNGVGLPDNFNITKINSLGMQLIYSLCDQIDGKVKILKKKGLNYSICFPLRNDE